MRDWEIPALLQAGWSSPEKAPAELRPLAERMFAAEAFILLSPEYNGSYSAALKNLLDHFPKQIPEIMAKAKEQAAAAVSVSAIIA